MNAASSSRRSRPRPHELARRHDALRLLFDQQRFGDALDRDGEMRRGQSRWPSAML